MELVSSCASLDKSGVDEIIFMLKIFSLVSSLVTRLLNFCVKVSSQVTRWKRKKVTLRIIIHCS